MKITIYVLLVMALLGVFPSTAVSEETEIAVVQEVIVEKPQLSYRDRLEQQASRGEIRCMNAEITAYTASADECGNSLGITASGEKVQRGFVASSPAIPFGTILYIEGIGRVVVKDRGGAITKNHFDIYVETKEEAFNFGRQHRKVYFIGREEEEV